MKDSNGVGEGPYFISEEFDDEIGAKLFFINGPGIEDSKTTAAQDYTEATTMVKIRNDSYAEGQKAECVKEAVEEFRERAVSAALREMIRSKSQEDPEWAQERIANRIRALPAALEDK